MSNWFANGETSTGLRALLHDAAAANAYQRLPDSNCELLPAGTGIGDRDLELLANGVMSSLLARWREKYDFVILDSPPLLSVADARILSGVADGVIMVLRADHSKRPDAIEAFASLSGTGGRLLGTVLIDIVRSTTYYSHYHAYYQLSSPGAQPDTSSSRS